MSKGYAIVGACSLGIIVTFILFSYLLTTVHPKKTQAVAQSADFKQIPIEEILQEKIKSKEQQKKEEVKEQETNIPKEPPEAETKNKTEGEERLINTIDRSRREDKTVHVVYNDLMNTFNETATSNPSADSNNTLNVSHSSGFRRSINSPAESHIELNEDIVFKIVDEEGRPTIEIRILNQPRRSRRLPTFKSHPTQEIYEKDNRADPDLSKVKKFMPNNTSVLIKNEKRQFEQSNNRRVINNTIDADDTYFNKNTNLDKNGKATVVMVNNASVLHDVKRYTQEKTKHQLENGTINPEVSTKTKDENMLGKIVEKFFYKYDVPVSPT